MSAGSLVDSFIHAASLSRRALDFRWRWTDHRERGVRTLFFALFFVCLATLVPGVARADFPAQPKWVNYNLGGLCEPDAPGSSTCKLYDSREAIWAFWSSPEINPNFCYWDGGEFLHSGTLWQRKPRHLAEVQGQNQCNPNEEPQNFSAGQAAAACPSNSESIGGGLCRCNSGFREIDGQCSAGQHNSICPSGGGTPTLGNPCNPANG